MMDNSNYQVEFKPQEFANAYIQTLQLEERQFHNNKERLNIYFDIYIDAYMKAANWLKDTNNIN